MTLDLVIRNGTIVDGSGAPRYRGDVGVDKGRIVEIGRIRSAAERTIDADGLIVAPGFIDGHTHMDAQVAWDPIGSCSCWHGVTTVIMGNCGFALAPCKPEAREWFARCLTAVEDIPTEAMLADISGGEAQRRFFARLKQVAVQTGRPVMFGTLSSRQGDKPNPWTYQLEYMDECAAAGARMWGQATTRSINAIFSLKSYLPFDVLPGWQRLRRLPLEEQKRRLADPATRRQLIAEEERMKPRDNVLQGGGAATTDPRRPDYANLYAMKGVDWDDPTVAQ